MSKGILKFYNAKGEKKAFKKVSRYKAYQLAKRLKQEGCRACYYQDEHGKSERLDILF